MLQIKLLGAMDVSSPGGHIDLASAKLCGVLVYLAVACPRPVPRESLTEMLWGSHFEDQARQNFRQALSRLRKLLGAEVILAGDDVVRLDPALVRIDLNEFERLCQAGTGDALRLAAEMGREEFLAGFNLKEPGFADWLVDERRRIGTLAADANLRLGRIELQSGNAAAALACAEAVTAADEFHEEGHRLMLRSLAALGRKSEALKHFQAFSGHLSQQLGTAPEIATLQLVKDIKAGTSPDPSEEPGRASIAVMPFANLSMDPEQGYFADGMVDELITALSRMRWLTVISRSSTFIYKDRQADPRQVGRDFGVRYVLEGSVRKSGSQVRIAGQLIDAMNGNSIWAGRFDGSMESLFDLQDQVAAKVVAAISPRLEHAEIERSRRKPTGSLDAYDYYLRGLAEVHRWTREANREALSHFYRAIELDRRFGSAYGLAARCLSQRKSGNWVEDEVIEKAETEGLAALAVEFGRDDPVALATAGIALAYVVGKVREGGDLIDRALALNPSYAWGWLFNGWIKAWSGESDAAIASINRAISLSPHDPDLPSMRRAIVFAHFIAGRYAMAIHCAEEISTSQHNVFIANASVAASAAMLGNLELARVAIAQVLAVTPNLRIAALRSQFPIVRDDDFARFAEGLRRAGLPE